MPDRSRWDPEMAAFTEMMDKEAAKYPPVRPAFPFEPNRRVNDILGMVTASGGPEMAERVDRFVDARGRRIFCRVFRPVTDRVLDPLSWLTPARWGLAATASTADVTNTVLVISKDSHWKHSGSVWLFDIAMLGVLSVFYAVLVRWQIRLRGAMAPNRSPREI